MISPEGSYVLLYLYRYFKACVKSDRAQRLIFMTQLPTGAALSEAWPSKKATASRQDMNQAQEMMRDATKL
jgi:hypothetical protein